MTKIMGILNVTPDSFSDGGAFCSVGAAVAHVEQMLQEGADVIDVGGYSSRPGATDISLGVELDRLTPVIEAIRRAFPLITISVDTFRSEVAARMLGLGANMINDISGGRDPSMFSVVAEYGAAYVVMHMQGTPQTMQLNPKYGDVVSEVAKYLRDQVGAATLSGISEVWCDPGFGFGKTLSDNYKLLASLGTFSHIAPTVVGVSRKGMFWRPLKVSPRETIPAASAAHLWALQSGVGMLRVHDVFAAVQVISVFDQLKLEIADMLSEAGWKS